ncbi:Hypothetical protein FKW44_007780, partial [Caligus rogercresseyi]
RADSARADACLWAERCGDCKIEVLTASMFSGVLTRLAIRILVYLSRFIHYVEKKNLRKINLA